MEEQDKTTFSLDDDEIVEEELIERDEEYDDGEDYDDEDYDDEEEYDEEEDYDDDYDDEEEEDYDDGYNDDYYDDRLNKVLDEIAELKRGMVPAQQQQIVPQMPMQYPPQYIYQPSAPPAGSEVVMYNEISRLRDELAKNQSNLEMQKELSRLKDDMARDQRFAESQYNAEIKRLQDRIDDLLKNGSSPQGELPPAEAPARIEGGKGSAQSLDFDRLLSINEAVLRSTKDSDSRIQGEISQLRKQIEAMPSVDELNKAVSAVKKAAGSADGVNADVISRLSNDIAALRTAIEEKSGGAMPVITSCSGNSECKAGDIATSELLRQLYEIKNMLGSPSEDTEKHNLAITELLNEFKKLKVEVRSENVSLDDKLTSVYKYADKLNDSKEQDAVDLIVAVNSIISELSSTVLDRTKFGELVSYLSETGEKSKSLKRNSADKYFSICDKIQRAAPEDISGYLPELVEELNELENNRYDDKNNGVVSALTNALLADPRDNDAIYALIAQLTELRVSDIATLEQIQLPDNYKVQGESEEEVSLYALLSDIKSSIGTASNDSADSEAAAAATVATSSESDGEVLGAINELKAQLEAVSGMSDVSQALEEIRENYIDLANRLVDISDRLAEPASESSQVMSEDDKAYVLEDLQYIRNKLDDQDVFIGQISDLRSEINGMSSNMDLAEQVNSIITELTAQSDKLYEDISNVLIESEANILGRIGEMPIADMIADAKTEIIADNQSVKDAVLALSDASSSQPVIDALEQLRTDVNALSDITSVNTDAATLDRQKLLDDVAFLREQAELALAETDRVSETPSEDNNELKLKIYGYLDDLSERIAPLAPIPEDVEALRESVNAVADNVAALLENAQQPVNVEEIAEIRENVNATFDAVLPISENVSAVNEKLTNIASDTVGILENIDHISADMAETVNIVRPLTEEMASVRDAATATFDALSPISDQLNAILEKLEAPIATETENESEQYEKSVMADEELVELKDSLNTILDTLPLFPQADDLIAARDNTYAIIDTLAPINDDVLATHENVEALIDSVAELKASIDALTANPENNTNVAGDIAALREDIDTLRDAMPQTVAEDLALVRDNTVTIVDSLASLTQSQEDIGYIRQRVDEAPDMTVVLDKLTEYEQTSQTNKQEILDAVSGIREEFHINTLDENISAAGIDDETRDMLVTEITDIRERLSNIENNAVATGDNSLAALDNISAQLTELQAMVEAKSGTASDPDAEAVEADSTVLTTLDDINEKLNAILDGGLASGSVDSETLNALANDIADIKALLESGEVASENAQSYGEGSVSAESLQAIVDELSLIREKLDGSAEYDTIGEILSLRDDIKAARIVDQNDVSGELESIKNELAALASESILDEIRALRDEISGVHGVAEEGEVSAHTDDELNLVLNEIVSLRDEVFALKDEILNATAAPEAVETEVETAAQTGEDVNAIIDELTALRVDQNALGESIDELKDIISRRTTISSTEDGEVQSASGELDVVLDEIINLKNNIDAIGENNPNERLDAIASQVEDVLAIVDELRNAAAPEEATIDEATNGTITEQFESLRAEIDEIKSTIVEYVQPADYSAELEGLREEIAQLRAENEQLKQENTDAVAYQLAELREAIRDMTLGAAPAVTEAGDTSYAALIEEIKELKSEIASVNAAAAPVSLDEDVIESIRNALAEQSNVGMAEELSEIRDEIAQLRSLTTVAAESNGGVEVAAIRDEIADIKSMLASPDSLYGVAEDVTVIKSDVQRLKDEPDLGVMNEILALRDEFQTLREEIEDVKRIAGETDRESDEHIMSEVQSLRDQLFAISMANVNDPTSGETNYESYNNIILDELASLRDQVESAPSTDLTPIADEISKLKSLLDKREQLYDALAARVNKLDNDATNNKILEELSSMRNEIANQRDADLTTLNFMSEMAHLLERQNRYLTQNTSTKITDEIESLKAEIASTDAVAEEVAKLRELMTQTGVATDNESILSELAELREELSNEKPSRENALILDAIARLNEEVTALTERDKRAAAAVESDDELSDSLSDLKNQLNEIANIIDPEKKPASNSTKVSTSSKSSSTSTSRSSSSTGAKRGRKPGSKNTVKSSSSKSSSSSTSRSSSSTGAKRGRKPAQKPAEVSEPINNSLTEERSRVETVDITTIIDEQASMLGGKGEMSLDPTATTTDALTVADKLAKQVANKLIMEQLVEQLGDGGVSDERIDEILRDILPQEFTTIAETESSDKIRRLANQLVLNKLRARLSGRDTDED